MGQSDQDAPHGAPDTIYQYDKANRLTLMCEKLSSGGQPDRQTTVFDAAGRLVTSERQPSGQVNTYSYNSRNELIEAASNGVVEHSWRYNAIGGRLAAHELGSDVAYRSNSLNQYAEVMRDGVAFAPRYDADGNQSHVRTSTGMWRIDYLPGYNRPCGMERADGSYELYYDHSNRLHSVTQTTGDQAGEGYDLIYLDTQIIGRVRRGGEGRRNLETWLWDPTQPVAAKPLAMYVHDGIGQSNPTGYYYQHDHNKNVTALTDDQGNKAAVYQYSPYGTLLSGEGLVSELNPFRFSSEYHDDITGLINYLYRQYNPLDGSWLQRDPIGESGGMNLYGFVRNNPVSKWDRLGLITWNTNQGNCTRTMNYVIRPLFYNRNLTREWLGIWEKSDSKWTKESKEKFKNDLKNSIKNSFNNQNYKTKPDSTGIVIK